MKANELSPGWAMTQTDPAAKLQQVINNVMNYGSRQIARSRAAVVALIPSLVLLAQASLLCAFGFGMIFLASIIGG